MKYLRALKIFRAIVADETRQYQQHPDETAALARDAYDRAQRHRAPLRRAWDDLTTFLRLLRSWGTGKYKLLPWKSLGLIIGAVLYFMTPLDAIPDFIPGIGFLDDVFIVAWVMRYVRRDVEDFRQWENV
jgi:uncharacterized membrane protein YkvA (DUF1232 family)